MPDVDVLLVLELRVEVLGVDVLLVLADDALKGTSEPPGSCGVDPMPLRAKIKEHQTWLVEGGSLPSKNS